MERPVRSPRANHEALARLVVGGRSGSGRKNAPASSQVSLPPQWDQRCTAGDQPPDMATASQITSSITAPSPACLQSCTATTPRIALDARNGGPGPDRNAKRTCLLRQRPVGRGPRIHDARHVEARAPDRDGGAIGVVVVGHDDRAVAGAHAILHGGNRAPPRPASPPGLSLPAKLSGALDRADGRDHLPCPDAPQPVARHAVLRRVVGDALIGQQV